MPTTQDMTTVEALARLSRHRDTHAWEELLRLHGAAIHRVCLRILGDDALAEDACQETLLQLRDRAGLFKAGTANSEAAARSWIMRVACNSALQMLRQRKAARRREDKAAREETRAEPDAYAHAEQAERLEAVRRELAAMPEHERMPLVLHYHAGLGFEDVAQALGCPVNTAKSRVHRGIERLRNRLALLGMILALNGLEDLLTQGHASGPRTPADTHAYPPGSEQWQVWQQLLHSSRTSTLPYYQPEGAWSTMAKLGIGTAALLAALFVFLASDTLRSAEQPSPAPAPLPPSAQPHAPTSVPVADGEAQPQPAKAPDPAQEAPATAAERAEFARNINAFSLLLYQQTKGSEKDNLFLSPYSASTALSMTYSGARGNTAAEMKKALAFTLAASRQHVACGSLMADLNAAEKNGKPRGFNLAVANRLFGRNGIVLCPEFLAVNRDLYHAPLESMDFVAQPESSRKAINAWVEKQTHDRIKDLIGKGMITPATSLVLVNAIYFKGTWDVQFKKELTAPAPFFTSPGQKIQAQMMHGSGSYKYLDVDGAFQALELPYQGKELSMLVFLPAKEDGLAAFEATLSEQNLADWTNRMQDQTVDVNLPRFKMTWGSTDLVPALKALGMLEAFTGNADFSGVSAQDKLTISVVLHKAFVDVNEEGTEAAAATAVAMQGGSAPNPKARPVFNANRPFFFAIRDNASNAILFMGRVAHPTSE